MAAYRDKKNGKWFVKFRYRTWQNEMKWITKRGFATKRDAQTWERDFLHQQSGNPTMGFKEFVDIYKRDRLLRLKPSTQCLKESILDTKILPYFEKKQLNDISSSDVIQWQNTLMKMTDDNGRPLYSQSYLKTLHSHLSAIFNHAVRHYGLKCNPAAIAGNMGTDKHIQMKYWTLDQYLKFAEAAMADPVMFYCYETLYWTGIREGELLALNRSDFDLKKKQVSISKTFHHLNGQDIITDPKTPKSRRIVTLPDSLCEELNEYFSSIYDLSPGDRVFPVSKSSLKRNLRKFALQQSLPVIRVHDLRHSHVSLLIDMGFSPVAIAARMGHESIDITYRYAHMFPSVQGQMSEKLNTLRKGEESVAQEP